MRNSKSRPDQKESARSIFYWTLEIKTCGTGNQDLTSICIEHRTVTYGTGNRDPPEKDSSIHLSCTEH